MREPGGAEVGVEERDVNEIGRGVAEISEEGEKGHGKKSDEMERRAKMWPGSDEADDAYAEQDKVVEDAARFPEASGGGKEFAEVVVVLGGEGLRRHGEPPERVREHDRAGTVRCQVLCVAESRREF